MDILYYSNYCKHSQRILQFFEKNNLANKVNFISVDRRRQDPKTGQVYVFLENGTQVLLPPNVHSVPSLLLTKESYSVITGDSIMEKFKPYIETQNIMATKGNGEPVGMGLITNTSNPVISDQYTFYSATPEELSAKGTGRNRQMHNYVSAFGDSPNIYTPPDNYRPNKLSEDVTVDSLQRSRNEDIQRNGGNTNDLPPFLQPQKI